MLHFI